MEYFSREPRIDQPCDCDEFYPYFRIWKIIQSKSEVRQIILILAEKQQKKIKTETIAFHVQHCLGKKMKTGFWTLNITHRNYEVFFFFASNIQIESMHL